MTQLVGWWDWDSEAKALRNRVTGESLRYLRGATKEEVGFGFTSAQRLRGRAAEAASWHRFQYEHGDLSYPLVVAADVEARDVVDDAELRGRCRFVLDHGLSWHVYRRESGREEPAPPYGIFRRINDCVPDGLLFWPASATVAKSFEPKQGLAVGVIGGWLNAQWRPDSRRIERTLAEDTLYFPTRGDLVDGTAVPSNLEDLPPPPLRFVNTGTLADKSGAVHLKPLHMLYPDLTSDAIPSAGVLKERVARETVYLRDDALSTIFYCVDAPGVSRSQALSDGQEATAASTFKRVPARPRGHMGFPKMQCAYVDPKAVSLLSVTGLTESFYRHLYGSTQLTLPHNKCSEMRIFGDETGEFPIPSLSLLRFLISRYLDCFDAWEGIVADKSDWDEQLTLDACRGVYIHCAYRSGIYRNMHRDFLSLVDFGV